MNPKAVTPRRNSFTLGIDASRAARSRRTGTETYALELINALAALTTSEFRLRLYTPHRPAHPKTWPASPYVETRVIPWPRLWTHLRLSVELHRQPPNALFVPAHVLPLSCPVPALVTVHDLGYHYFPETHRPFDRWYLDWTTRRHCRVARHILADSQATKDDLVNIYQADPARVSVVYLGRDESLSRIDDPALIEVVKAKYGLDSNYLLYLGTVHPRKNLTRLLEAFQRALSTIAASPHDEAAVSAGPTLKLVIAGGKGWLTDEIFRRVQVLGLENHVFFPGYIPAKDKAALLSGALAYVFPSLYEGFGLPVLEAMACGVPVLTSKVSSLPEVAGDAALLVDPHRVDDIAQGVVRIVTELALRQKLVARGYQQLERFTWDSAAAQILDITRSVFEFTV